MFSKMDKLFIVQNVTGLPSDATRSTKQDAVYKR